MGNIQGNEGAFNGGKTKLDRPEATDWLLQRKLRGQTPYRKLHVSGPLYQLKRTRSTVTSVALSKMQSLIANMSLNASGGQVIQGARDPPKRTACFSRVFLQVCYSTLEQFFSAFIKALRLGGGYGMVILQYTTSTLQSCMRSPITTTMQLLQTTILLPLFARLESLSHLEAYRKE